MTIYETMYWKVFNKLAKVVGYVFLFGGIYGSLRVAIILLDPELNLTTQSQHDFHQSAPKEINYLSIGLSVGMAVAGYFIIKAKPYFPKNAKERTGDN